MVQSFDREAMEARAAQVAGILRALANERRLMILCRLVECGEANVSTLAEAVGLSQSALSQHLAKMRAEGLVPSDARARRCGTALPIPGSRNSSPRCTSSSAPRRSFVIFKHRSSPYVASHNPPG